MKLLLVIEAALVAFVSARSLRSVDPSYEMDEKKFEMNEKKFDDEGKMEPVYEKEPEYVDFDAMKPVEGYPLQPDLLDFNPKADNEDFVIEVRKFEKNKGYGGTVQSRNALNAPALVGQGMALSLFTLREGAQNLIHYHPRATELLYLIKGKLEVGFTDTQGRLYKNILKEGQATIFPRALLHFQRNVGYGEARYVSMLNSENPGTVSLPRSLFTLPGNILSQAFRKELKKIKKVQGDVIPVELRNPYLEHVKGYYDGKAGKFGDAPVPEFYKFGYGHGYGHESYGHKGYGYGHDDKHDIGYGHKGYGYGHDDKHDTGYGHKGYGHDDKYDYGVDRYDEKHDYEHHDNDYFKKYDNAHKFVNGYRKPSYNDYYKHSGYQPKYEPEDEKEDEIVKKPVEEEPLEDKPKKEEPKKEEPKKEEPKKEEPKTEKPKKEEPKKEEPKKVSAEDKQKMIDTIKKHLDPK